MHKKTVLKISTCPGVLAAVAAAALVLLRREAQANDPFHFWALLLLAVSLYKKRFCCIVQLGYEPRLFFVKNPPDL